MRNVTESFQKTHHPEKALLIYRQRGRHHGTYIEAFDIEQQTGKPINAHPLSEAELDSLAKALKKKAKGKKQSGAFLSCGGMLPQNVLFLNTVFPGKLIWHTPAQKRQLYFKKDLTLTDGMYPIPPLLWCASADSLHLYALTNGKRPAPKTALQYAPFFNVSESGSVCMGSAVVNIAKTSSIEAFIQCWQEAFFNSYFSHLNGSHQPVEGNIIQLWQSLLDSKEPFPTGRLNPAGSTLDKLIAKHKQ